MHQKPIWSHQKKKTGTKESKSFLNAIEEPKRKRLRIVKIEQPTAYKSRNKGRK